MKLPTDDYVTVPVELDQFHGHEALDRTHMILGLIEHYLHCHPFIEQNEDVHKLVDQALSNLSQAYQLIGSKTL